VMITMTAASKQRPLPIAFTEALRGGRRMGGCGPTIAPSPSQNRQGATNS